MYSFIQPINELLFLPKDKVCFPILIWIPSADPDWTPEYSISRLVIALPDGKNPHTTRNYYFRRPCARAPEQFRLLSDSRRSPLRRRSLTTGAFIGLLMSHFHNNGKGTWGSHRPDTFPNGSSRRNNVGVRRDYLGLQRPPLDEEPSIRPLDDSNNNNSISGKLDQLLDRLDKFDSWRDETDRRSIILNQTPTAGMISE